VPSASCQISRVSISSLRPRRLDTATYFLTIVGESGYCAIAAASLSSRVTVADRSSDDHHNAWSRAQVHPIVLAYEYCTEKPRSAMT
jgi:hypothetical protein